MKVTVNYLPAGRAMTYIDFRYNSIIIASKGVIQSTATGMYDYCDYWNICLLPS